jgi:hypothetical protein
MGYRACYLPLVTCVLWWRDCLCFGSSLTQAGTAPQTALLRWAQAVCAKYNVIVRDFSESLADGKALCLLIHHYQPDLLPLAKIQRSVADRVGSPSSGAAVPGLKKAVLEAGLQAERCNFRMVKAQAMALGCIPFMGECTH